LALFRARRVVDASRRSLAPSAFSASASVVVTPHPSTPVVVVVVVARGRERDWLASEV
jgi:hypothetical protein